MAKQKTIITDLQMTVTLSFTKGNNIKLMHLSLHDLIHLDLDSIYEDMEETKICDNSNCHTKSQDYCNCPNIYDDYELTSLII